MDGVVDWVMRDLLTRIGGIDQCVTEFIRVVDVVYPDHVFYKRCPELKTGGKTASGTPVFVQILGGQAEPMALNALKAIELGAIGIDINFGCPAKTVNRNDGGATLLKSCDRINDIVKSVKKRMPDHIPLTVKIRLGYDTASKCIDIAKSIEDAGADLLTIHCRTKMDGYKPPAYWDWIPKIREHVKMDLVVNGDIWNLEDYKKCQDLTGESQFMVGRGAVADPFIFQKIKGAYFENSWMDTKKLLPTFFESSYQFHSENFAITRTKQWLKSLSLSYPEASSIFQNVKTITTGNEFIDKLQNLTNQ
ncbi:MAG: tRNA-dihydrouridine synthase family protein [Bdellovibrionales bacterium]|nr:tRNA-dihydrouridine synthase family protein [Bdellovibrionales bacterium]